MHDDSVLASFEASRQAAYNYGREAKLFFAFAFVDVYASIQDSMNIGSYNGSTVDRSNCWTCNNSYYQ